MSIRGPRFPTKLADAPEWVKTGVARFERLQRDAPRDLGSDPSTFVADGDTAYFPNAMIEWNAGMIGVIVAIAGLAGFVTLIITSAVFMDGVPGWTWIGLGASLGVGLLSLVYTAIKSPATTLRRDGMYLLAEGAAFVRGEQCSWAVRNAIARFKVYTVSAGTYREVLQLKKGDSIEIAAGKRPTLRDTAEAWRTGTLVEERDRAPRQ